MPCYTFIFRILQRREEEEATGIEMKEFALVVDGSTLAYILLDEAVTGIVAFLLVPNSFH